MGQIRFTIVTVILWHFFNSSIILLPYNHIKNKNHTNIYVHNFIFIFIYSILETKNQPTRDRRGRLTFSVKNFLKRQKVKWSSSIEMQPRRYEITASLKISELFLDGNDTCFQRERAVKASVCLRAGGNLEPCNFL